jgi:mitotic spindle assembly checkpoint protein MAD2
VHHASILFQRGLYPPESFERRNAHGASVLVATHPGLHDYVTAVLRQLSGAQVFRSGVAARARGSLAHLPNAEWLLEGTLQRLVLVVASVASGEVLERWVFHVAMEAEGAQG